MTKSKKYLIISGVLIAAIIIALAVTLLFVSNREEERTYSEYNPSGEVTQSVDTPTVIDTSNDDTTTVDNSDLSSTIGTPAAMQEIIDNYREDLNNSAVINQLAQSYPSNLIPIYKAKTAADSADIITDNGNPGWTAQYGSDASVEDITAFYEDLMRSTSGYSVQDSGNSVIIVGTVENCNVRITVSPNNPERTGLDDASNVSIYIERV